MRKTVLTAFIAFLCGFYLAVLSPAYAASSAGGASDPLVAQSWVDAYVEQRFAALETQLEQLRTEISQSGGKNVVLVINSNVYTVDGVSKTMDTAPIINSDWRTLVPIRFVAEALGCRVDYTVNARGSTDKVYIYGASTVELTINSSSYLVDGRSKTMDTAPTVNRDSRTLVPIRFVAEALGCKVSYDVNSQGSTSVVYISK